MPPRLHRLLPALALVAAVCGALVASVPVVVSQGAVEAAAAATAGHPRPANRPVRHVQPKPTVGERAVKLALRMVGTPYRWGGESPDGFDCSGLVRWAYGRVGVDLPHSSYALYGRGRSVSRGHMKPGDVLIFSGLGHVGLYVSRGRMVHAPYSGRDVEVVRLADWYGSRLIGVRRVASA
jgi:cell wall-associated NlpC family hydrolase